MKINHFAAIVGVAAALTAVSLPLAHSQDAMQNKPVEEAVAVLFPTRGSDAAGVVTFRKQGDMVQVRGMIRGLTPGEHGFHVHEYGDLTSRDGTSAGGHFNPTGAPHSAPGEMPRHVGDLGNITADASGVARIDKTDNMIQFLGDSSIIGRGLVVHAKADDLKSQPSGDAGARVAVGVIGVQKP